MFEEFARKIAPSIHLFGNVNINLDPAITAEFAHAVYRFGHSMLDETLPRFELNADGTNSGVAVDGTQIGLIEAFLNPLEYLQHGADAAGQLVQGTTNQIGSEIDEFVTGALRNNLLGLPLDLRGPQHRPWTRHRRRRRSICVRAELFSRDPGYRRSKPYASWDEFRQFLKHRRLDHQFRRRLRHACIDHRSADHPRADKRAAAIDARHHGGRSAPARPATPSSQDAYDFMHSLGAYANDVEQPVGGARPMEHRIGHRPRHRRSVDRRIGRKAEPVRRSSWVPRSTSSSKPNWRICRMPTASTTCHGSKGIHFGSEIEGEYVR